MKFLKLLILHSISLCLKAVFVPEFADVANEVPNHL